MNTKTALRCGLAALCLTVLTTACSSGGEQKAGDPVQSLQTNQQLHDDLPADVISRGELRIVTDASYAPASSFAPDGRTIIGFEPDLGAALGKVLGIKVVFSNAGFGTLPDLVNSGRADLIMSAMTDTAEREKHLDFIDYFSAGTSLVVQRGNPHGISDLQSLCGQRVAVEEGTVQFDLLTREQSHCVGRGIRIVTAPTNDDALLKLRTGEVAALPMDYPPAEALTVNPRTQGNYQLASTAQYEPGLYGIGVAKSQNALRDVVWAALAELIRSGVYMAVLQAWDVAEGAISAPSANAAGQS
jgi:polar amino acid transport system substrate-binding protein